MEHEGKNRRARAQNRQLLARDISSKKTTSKRAGYFSREQEDINIRYQETESKFNVFFAPVFTKKVKFSQTGNAVNAHDNRIRSQAIEG